MVGVGFAVGPLVGLVVLLSDVEVLEVDGAVRSASVDGGRRDRTDQVGLERSSVVSTQLRGFLKLYLALVGSFGVASFLEL